MRNRRPLDRVLRVTAACLGAVSPAALVLSTAALSPAAVAWGQNPTWQGGSASWQGQSPVTNPPIKSQLGATAGLPQTISLSLKRFEIPFTVDRSASQPSEVQLLVSRDQGGRWDLFAAQPVTGRNFSFLTDQDGTYWFATRTVDAAGKTDSLESLRPQLIVNVDTTSPTVDLDAWFDDQGYVQIKATCTDQSPALDNVRIQFAVDQSRQWVSVTEWSGHADPSAPDRYYAVGQFWPPEQAQQITVRAAVTDAAGNVTGVSSQVNRPRVAAGEFRLAGSPSPSSWAVPQFAISSGAASEPPPVQGGNDARASGPSFSGPSFSGPIVSGPATAGAATMDIPSLPPSSVRETLPETTAIPSDAAGLPPATQRPATAAGAMRPIGPDDLTPAGTPQVNQPGYQPPTPSADPYRAQMPSVGEPSDLLGSSGVQVRFSSSRKFSLEYEVESTGLAGVSDVELWGTRDRGLTWKRWGADPDRQSPFDIETNHDGAYGFRIVVVANNGLATPRPIENDLPDIFVVVDTQRPEVRITGAAYGEGNHTGSLVIRYQCTDLHLTERPISLSFGPSTAGPWTTIAAGLINEGAYLWPADPHLPRQIYLRIDGIDLAGNEGSYVLDTPIDVQGLAPRARIRGFNPLTGSVGGNRPADSTAKTNGSESGTAAQPQGRFR